MSKAKKSTIEVRGATVTVLSQNQEDFICITDIARYKDAERTDYLISNWLRNRNTIEFLGVWERLNNPGFNPIEFDGIRKQAGLNSFILTAKRWIETTGAIGLVSKTGRYGGTFAHKDIAFEFASWVSVEFKLHLIKEFQRLKDDENNRLKLNWNLQRTLAKINYRIHTDAIKETLLPPAITKAQASTSLWLLPGCDEMCVRFFGARMVGADLWADRSPRGGPGTSRPARHCVQPHPLLITPLLPLEGLL
ncbi:MAG: KilA-N domain-containing protein [Verrucomicrobia bacterium]|nr:KilA-N domain-containing protein [Verrucomicrobiota bacterium]